MCNDPIPGLVPVPSHGDELTAPYCSRSHCLLQWPCHWTAAPILRGVTLEDSLVNEDIGKGGGEWMGGGARMEVRVAQRKRLWEGRRALMLRSFPLT